jgi:hypothetical protein
VYQAYSDRIADAALGNGRFVSPPFRLKRMTWIKPSFLWMMYRAGWGQKDEDQRRILAIDISRAGFEWALSQACLSHYELGLPYAETEWRRLNREAPVKVQWDPERDLLLRPLPHRAIQIGLRGEAIRRYTDDWILGIADMTEPADEIARSVDRGDLKGAADLLPEERPYRIPPDVARRLGIHLGEHSTQHPATGR